MSNTDAICKQCGSGYWRPECEALNDTGYCTDACYIADLKEQVEELTDKYVSEAQDLVTEQLANDKLRDEIAELKAQVAEKDRVIANQEKDLRVAKATIEVLAKRIAELNQCLHLTPNQLDAYMREEIEKAEEKAKAKAKAKEADNGR